MQYLNYVEVIAPEKLRERIKENLANAMGKYSTQNEGKSE